MIIGVPKETHPGERRVALVPGVLSSLTEAGLDVLIEKNAGTAAGYDDRQYEEKGASIALERSAVFKQANVVLSVRAAGASPRTSDQDVERFREGQVLIGLLEPLWRPKAILPLAERKVTAFALELLPRITRAQSMDVLSSMATVAGYKAALLAADALPRMFPLMMTAAGSITPAKVFVIGAGVAGLQAIATARRLGAVVRGHDIRPAAKQEVESLGAKFVELDLGPAQTEGEGGYAKAMDDEFYRKQRELIATVVAESDVVITTAAVPGKKSPVLVTGEMVERMRPGSVIVDLAAERGGNCELSKPDERVVEHGVTILAPAEPTCGVPYHASQMFARNISKFLLNLVKDGKLALNRDDEIVAKTLVTHEGEITSEPVRKALAADPADGGEGRKG